MFIKTFFILLWALPQAWAQLPASPAAQQLRAAAEEAGENHLLASDIQAVSAPLEPSISPETRVNILISLRPFEEWRLVTAVPLQFPTNEPEGLIKLGKRFFLSTVDKTSKVGFLIEFDASGNEIQRIPLAEPAKGPNGGRYHAGGLDYDASSGKILLPLAEFRPKSSASILQIDPASLAVKKIFEFPDHVGGLIADEDNQKLRLINWDYGIYSIPLDAGNVFLVNHPGQAPFIPPEQGYQYQDCKSVGQGYAVCSGALDQGLNTLWQEGVVDVIHFEGGGGNNSDTAYHVIRRIPVPRVTRSGQSLGILPGITLAANPLTLEFITDPSGQPLVRFYFIPHEGPNSVMLIYDAHSLYSDDSSVN